MDGLSLKLLGREARERDFPVNFGSSEDMRSGQEKVRR
jgi:hypothetical protein